MAGRGRDKRKDMQLCAQVRGAIEMALMEFGDEALHGAWVREVLPNPDAKSLIVIVEAADREGASAALHALHPRIRHEMAGAIHRKRTPELTIRVVPPQAPESPA